MKRATIKDVAALAGVSIATVSHVLNETKFVSSSNTEKVRRAVTELGYRPSGVASSLRRQESGVIGLVLPMQGQDSSAAFFTRLAAGIEKTVASYGYRTIISNTEEDATREHDQLELFHGQFTDFIDGLIIAPTFEAEPEQTEYVQLGGLPCVYVDRLPLGLTVDLDFVGTNNYSISLEGLQQVIGQGTRDIVCISSPIDVSSMVDRRRAFCDAVSPYVNDAESRIYVTSSSFDAGYEIGLKVLNAHPNADAFFVTNSTIAMGFIKALHEIHGADPSDLGLLVYDDSEWMDLVRPAINSIEQPAYGMGQRAAELLLHKMREPQKQPERVTLESTLTMRSTQRGK